ncbi:MAG: acetolactate decarboxylase [Candidatus Nanoarchaeia archaeon]
MEKRTNNNIIFQNSTINALLEGLYDGDITFEELSNYGNLGLGTFNNLDGEMIALDGEFFKIKADSGQVYYALRTEKTPFSVVTHFSPDTSIILIESMSFNQLQDFLSKNLPSQNIFYAFRIEGLFKYIKTRSVPRQSKPYPRLVEVVKRQPIFEFHDIDGYLVGFYFPEYMKDINVPGYHFHFISRDKKKGGHLLECQTVKIKIDIDHILGFQMILPDRSEFRNMDLSSKNAELNKVER